MSLKKKKKERKKRLFLPVSQWQWHRSHFFYDGELKLASFQDGGWQESQKREHILKLILEVRTDSRTSARLLFISCLNYRAETAEEEPAGYKTEVRRFVRLRSSSIKDKQAICQQRCLLPSPQTDSNTVWDWKRSLSHAPALPDGITQNIRAGTRSDIVLQPAASLW